jgi:hypothetical protein
MDIKDLSEQQILELLSKGEKIPYYQNLSINPESRYQEYIKRMSQRKK